MLQPLPGPISDCLFYALNHSQALSIPLWDNRGAEGTRHIQYSGNTCLNDATLFRVCCAPGLCIYGMQGPTRTLRLASIDPGNTFRSVWAEMRKRAILHNMKLRPIRTTRFRRRHTLYAQCTMLTSSIPIMYSVVSNEEGIYKKDLSSTQTISYPDNLPQDKRHKTQDSFTKDTISLFSIFACLAFLIRQTLPTC